MSKNFANNVCETSSCCPCGWLKKSVFGLSLCTWLVLFAVLPYSARGVAWTFNSVVSVFKHGADVVAQDRPVVRRNAPQK